MHVTRFDMPQAIWHDAIIASELGKNPDRVRTKTVPTYCHWKGIAYYYDISVDGDVNAGAAWTYRTPYTVSRVITDHIAFWNGVEVLGAPAGTG